MTQQAFVDEPVHVEPYQPAWAQVFLEERHRLAARLGAATADIQHTGSTAVPGLSAKPIVDIVIGADRVPPPEHWSNALIELGYEALGEAGVPGRWYFRLRVAPFRNVHVVERGGTHWRNNLALRQYLGRSPEAVRRYEAAKLDAIASGATTLLAYSDAKSRVVGELLAEALLDQAGDVLGDRQA